MFKRLSLLGSFQKIQVPEGALEDFFLRKDEFDFLTVTMPHKKSIVSFCDELSGDAKAIGCVNFISNINGKLIGCNFDGKGTLDPIEKRMPVMGKKVVVVGAGGAAKAAIYEAKKRGAHTVCVNRTKASGEETARLFEVDFASAIPEEFDVLINATSVGMDPHDKRLIVPAALSLEDKIVLDMASRDGVCELKKHTLKDGGIYIPGTEMFLSLTEAAMKNHGNLLNAYS